MAKQKRTTLTKNFFSGKITALEFITALEDSYRYRGFHSKPDELPRWSGPFRNTRAQADKDNARYFNAGYNVDIYIEQYV